MYRLLFTVAPNVYTWLQFKTVRERGDFISTHKNWNLKKFDKRIGQ